MKLEYHQGILRINIKKTLKRQAANFFRRYRYLIITLLTSVISVAAFAYYFGNGLSLAYNDARSHLDIARRVVEGLKPGMAQLGSVWLPLPHFLMVPTIWSDFMWHTGLSGAIISMLSFLLIGITIYKFLEELGVGTSGKIFAVMIFITNINILYLQTTAMTELLLLMTMTVAAYYLLLWAKEDKVFHLIKSAFFIMLSTLTRYDGWFLLFSATLIIFFIGLAQKRYKETEGKIILFLTLGSLGVLLWLLWNLLIFNDPLYFAFGPFSAHAQQSQLSDAGELDSKYNLPLSVRIYLHALLYNSYTIPVMISLAGLYAFLKSRLENNIKIATMALLAPLFFNILALYLGHSVLFVAGISGNTWFNVRYGVMLAPTIAIFIGFLFDKAGKFRLTLSSLIAVIALFAFINHDAVTVDDARYGSSQKNVTEVSSWLSENAANKDGFVLISAASHDAIIFSSGMPMKKFIHEGTGAYWQSAVSEPDRWARWIVARTHDNNDMTWKNVSDKPGFSRYKKVESYPFADIYELKEEYVAGLVTKPIYGKDADLKRFDRLKQANVNQ